MTSPTSTNLTLAFSEQEDRLVLFATSTAGMQQACVLTRRLTARLINGIALVLERSNIAASTAPDDLRSDIVLMEHQGALAGTAEAQGGASEGPAALEQQQLKLVPSLVSNVRLTTNPQNFELVFEGKGAAPIQVVLNRIDLHRLVEVLKRQAEHAGWNLQIDVGWLGDDQSLLTVN